MLNFYHLVNTKAFVKFHVTSADWLSDHVKTRLQEMVEGRVFSVQLLLLYIVQVSY